MPLTESEAMARVTDILRRTFGLQSDVIVDRATTANDINGWDSVSHAVLLMTLEDGFGLELPLDQTLEARNVGDLVDVIVRECAA